MKKSINIWVFTAAAIFLVSCKDFLHKVPNNVLVVENSYLTPQDIDRAVIGCYNGLVKIKRVHEHYFNESRSDNALYPNTDNVSSDIDGLTPSLLVVSPTNDYMTPYWTETYNLISRTNLVLEHLNLVTDPSKNTQYEAEARFLRAWTYFSLVRYFGAVPLITNPVSSEEAVGIDRTSADEVLSWVENEMTASAQLFGSLENYKPAYGRIHQWSVKGMLAKVYLFRGKKTEALPLLEDVYSNSGFKLTANYEDLFTSAVESTKGAEEILFPIRFTSNSTTIGNRFSGLLAVSDISAFGSHKAIWSEDLLNVFINTTDTLQDRRYPVTMGKVVGSWLPGLPSSVPDLIRRNRYPPKMVGLVNNAGIYTTAVLETRDDGPLDWPELRFADVVLMLAEVKGQTEGLPLLNKVRTRSKAPLLTDTDITNMFGGSFQEAVLNERRMELAFENDRFWDLRRMGDQYAAKRLYEFIATQTAYTDNYPTVYEIVKQVTAGNKIDNWRLLLPIPLNEILRSNVIKQNPGYAD